MVDDALAPELTIWTDASHAALVARVLDLMGSKVRLIGVGGSRSSEVAALARSLDSSFEDDFRKLLVEHPAGYVLLTSMEGIGRDDIPAAVGQGAIVLTLEPLFADFDSLQLPRGKAASDALAGGAGSAGRSVFVPSFRHSPGWMSADPLEALSPPRVISFASFGGPDEGSLFARLYDAWQVVLSLTQLPESIDASLISSLPAAPENLRAATGHLTAHARLPGGAAAILEVSDRTGRAARRLRIVGDQGRLRVSDFGYEFFDAAGLLLDERPPAAMADAFVELIVAQWLRWLDRPDAAASEPPGPSESHLLACCLATLLSARTGQPESPEKMLAWRR